MNYTDDFFGTFDLTECIVQNKIKNLRHQLFIICFSHGLKNTAELSFSFHGLRNHDVNVRKVFEKKVCKIKITRKNAKLIDLLAKNSF